MRLIFFTFLLFTVSLLPAQTAVLPPGFSFEENYITGLMGPTDLKIAPDGRIFITEKSGTVRIIENGLLLPQPFFMIQTQIPNERGLDGILLDPDFEHNGYVYLYSTLPYENKNKLTRVTASGNTAIAGSEIELARFDLMWGSWHNGGGMVFDTAGKIIVGTGDGLTAGPQHMDNSLGKILRFNSDGTIPEDNPFYNQLIGDYRAIAGLGIRNPYSMDISKSTGRIFFNDVGNTSFEEVNEYIPGKNFGWPFIEGMWDSIAPVDTNYKDPVHVYDHDFGCAIVGAAFYEPDVHLFPDSLFGKYFFLEYCEGILLYMDPNTFQVTEFASGLGHEWNNLETSDDGYLYLINVSSGRLGRISYQGINAPPVISRQPLSAIAATGEDVTFSAFASGDSVRYAWYINHIRMQSGLSNSFTIENVTESFNQAQIFVEVFNPHGMAISDTAILSVVNGARPSVVFGNIPDTYAAGDTINFSAVATDPDQQNIPADDYTWWIDFHHDEHRHPALTEISGITSGAYYTEKFSDVDTNVFFRIHVVVTDSTGLFTHSTINVHPEKVNLQIRSEPPGVLVNCDGYTDTTDFSLRSVKNLNRRITMPEFQVIGDSLYQFRQWHDGSDTLARIFSAADDTISATYDAMFRYFPWVEDIGTMTTFTDTGSAQVFYKTHDVYEIKKNWDIINPYPWDNPPFPDDYFSVRWEGNIIAPISDLYTFYLFHDSKVSLRVGDSLLIDGAVTVPLREEVVQIWLNGGDSATIRVDYDHYTYISRVELAWSNSVMEKTIVPFMTQAPVEPPPPPPPPPVDSFPEGNFLLYPNPNDGEKLYFYVDSTLQGKNLEIEIYDMSGRLIQTQQIAESAFVNQISIAQIDPGIYIFKITAGIRVKSFKFIRE